MTGADADVRADGSAPQRPRGLLPLALTSFVGRAQEREELTRLLAQARLVTLTGPAGVGKTRLAIETARELGPFFPDGLWLVELAAISDPALVPRALARTLGIPETGDQPVLQLLCSALRDKTALVILDNFEQVQEAATNITELLAVCPALRVLVTSRVSLQLSGEYVFPVPPLDVPSQDQVSSLDTLAHVATVELFLQRAQAVQRGFSLTAANAATLVDIAVRLEGLPLAIELAAARSKHLPPRALLDRLDQRLPLLTGGARDGAPRHQSLRAALRWSYELLTPAQQSVMRRLAVFTGGCTLEAAEAVCAEAEGSQASVLDDVAALIDHSLLTEHEGPGGEARLAMLETIREFALEQLHASGEAADLRRRHAQYFVALAEEAGALMPSAQRELWAARIAADYENFRAAFVWSRSATEGAELELRLAGALVMFWDIYGPWSEGRDWLERALQDSAFSSPERCVADAKAFWGVAMMAFQLGDLPAARSAATEALMLARRFAARSVEGWVSYTLGTVALYEGNSAQARSLLADAVRLFQETSEPWPWALALFMYGDAMRVSDRGSARALYERSLQEFQRQGDAWAASIPLTSLGRLALDEGDYSTAQRCYEEGLALRRQLEGRSESRYTIAISLISLGEVARCQGDDERAAQLFEEALALSRELGSKPNVAWALHNLGHLARNRGDFDGAAARFSESLQLAQEIGQLQRAGASLVGMATVAAARGRAMPAARLFGAGLAVYDALDSGLDPADRLDYERYVTQVRRALGRDGFTAAFEAGRVIPLPHAVAEALGGSRPATPAAPTAGDNHPAAAAMKGARRHAGLTARELEVLELLARGLTNPEIAERLVLSAGTVARHTANIYTKLGVRSRVEATSFALRHRLFAPHPEGFYTNR